MPFRSIFGVVLASVSVLASPTRAEILWSFDTGG